MSDYVFRNDGAKCRHLHIDGCSVFITPDSATGDDVAARLAADIAELRSLRATVVAMSAVVEHFGQAGHFCAADKCRFHLHSHVNGFCVSTVGEWRPEDGEMRWLAAAPESFYETMVFVLVDGDHDGNEIYCKRYATRDEANAGHVAAVENYRAAKAKEQT